MAGEEPLNLTPNGTLKLDTKSIKLDMLTCESMCGTVQWYELGLHEKVILNLICSTHSSVTANDLRTRPITSHHDVYYVFMFAIWPQNKILAIQPDIFDMLNDFGILFFVCLIAS